MQHYTDFIGTKSPSVALYRLYWDQTSQGHIYCTISSSVFFFSVPLRVGRRRSHSTGKRYRPFMFTFLPPLPFLDCLGRPPHQFQTKASPNFFNFKTYKYCQKSRPYVGEFSRSRNIFPIFVGVIVCTI